MSPYKYCIIFFIVGEIFVIGCKSKDDNKKVIITRSYYSNGSLKSEYTLNDDSLKHGLNRKFYPNGIIEFEVEYLNDKKEGDEKGYYESGKLKYTIPYQGDVKSGFSKWYFESGNLLAEIPYYKGNPVGELNYYDSTGRLENYIVNDFDGRPKFNVVFDSLNRVKNVSGTAIVDVSHNGISHFLGDTLKVLFLIATPPKSKCKFYVVENLRDAGQRKELQIDSANSLVRWNKPITKEETTEWGGYIQIDFADKTKKTYAFKGKVTGSRKKE